MCSDQMPRPGEDLVHQLPSLPGRKTRQMPGGGVFKLRFDWYIIDRWFADIIIVALERSEVALKRDRSQ